MAGNFFEQFDEPAPKQDAPSKPSGNFFERFDEGAKPAAGDGSAAVGRGIVNGVPVVGPYLLAGVNRGVAAVRTLQNGTTFPEELKKVEAFGEETAKENPWATTGGELLGGAIGTAPLVAVAPAAFGAGAGALPGRMVASAGSGAAIGIADSAVRANGDATETLKGGGIGLIAGGASPALGAAIGKGVSLFSSRGRGEATVREALDGFTEQELASAQHIQERARALPGGGVELSLDEALNAATGGRAGPLSQLNRVVTNSGGEAGRTMGEFYARRPASVDNVGKSGFDRIAPANPAPSAVGFDVQDAARAGMAQTPEGQALARSRAAQAPRITPEQAGQAIQSDLGGVRALREAARSSRANVDYRLAREAPENVGVERTVTVERPGEPIVTQPQYSRPQFDGNAPAPLQAPPGVEAAPRAESMLRFLAKEGLPLDAETRVADLHRAYLPGFGTLARKNAPTWDQIRVRLMENGFIPPDAAGYAKAEGVRDMVLDAIKQERIGRGRTVRMGEDAAAGARRGQEADEFDNALSLASGRLDEDLTRAGVDPAGLHPDVRSRALNAMMSDERLDALDAYEQVVGSLKEGPRPYSKSTTVTEEVPDVRYGQVNPQAALDALDRQIRSAKGDVRTSLEGIRKDLYEHGVDPRTGVRETDMTVEGLLHARERIDQHIKTAVADGDGTKVRDLTIVRQSLDGQLKNVPEVAVADANYARNSVPLEPFERPNAPLGKVTDRVEQPGTEPGPFRMPAEQVPKAIAGPTALREALGNGGATTRAAAERDLSTRILDKATDGAGNVSAEKLRGAMRKNADALDQMPALRDRLGRLVLAREGMARVEASPLGQIANRPDVKNAIAVLFPAEPLANSQAEIRAAVEGLARNNARAARDTVRIYMETVFNEATQDLRGVASQYGGAGFASAVRGNSQQRINLEAAVRALPEGDALWTGLDNLLATLEATGFRPQKGSDTAFNAIIQQRLKDGSGPVGKIVTETVAGGAAGAGAGGPAGLAGGAFLAGRRAASDAMAQMRMLGDGAAVARILTDPKALPYFRSLARAEPGSRSAQLLVTKVLAVANGSRESAQGAP